MKVIRFIYTVIVITYIMLLFAVITIAGLVPYTVLRLIGIRSAADRVLRRTGRFLARSIIKGMGGKVIPVGIEKIPADASKICIVSNHQSYIDIPLLVGYLPIWAGFIAKEELTKIPFLKQWMRSMGCVYIKRGNPRSSIKMILDGVKKIQSGCPLIIFPEGTRSRSNTVNSFKAGSLKLATRSKSLLVPITIQNTYQLWEEDNRIKRTNIYLIVHDPIDTELIDDEQEKQLPKQVEQTIARGREVAGLQ